MNLTPENLNQFYKILAAPTNNKPPLLSLLAARIDQFTQSAFRLQGARAGHPAWPAFSKKTLKTDAGTWRIRYGTDRNPKRTREELAKYRGDLMRRGRWGWGFTGPMPGYVGTPRYSGNAKLLQSSGSFRKSFKILRITANSVFYGTAHERAAQIMSGGGKNPRPVMFVMPSDRKLLLRTVNMFTREQFKKEGL